VRERAADEEIFAPVAARRVLAHAQEPETPGSGPAAHLEPRIQRQRGAVIVEADPAREKGLAAFPLDAAELEDVGILQEECTLFREEQVESRQVGLARVGRRAGESPG
jgi:hypothetical protein